MWRIENDAPPFLDLLSTTRPARADEALMNRISSLHGFSTLSAIIRLSVFSGFTAQCIVIKHGSCLFFYQVVSFTCFISVHNVLGVS